MTTPWWVARVQALLDPPRLKALGLGELWRLREQLEFVRLNVQPALLEIDVAQSPSCASTWNALAPRAEQVALALRAAELELGARLKSGELGPEAFHAGWAALGFVRHADGGGTPADDYLDAMFHLSRLESGDERVAGATLNLSSRAERVSDFLSATHPGPADVVFDLGSGSGKVALTVAASTRCSVHGVEIFSSFVDEARRSADSFGMSRARFTAADVRDVDLSTGTIFYLFHPFHGPIAQQVANSLAELALRSPISLYVAGPQLGFGEHFLPHLASGALRLVERRGEFGEVSLLTSSLVPQTNQPV